MGKFISWVISLILAFVMLILGPLLYCYSVDEMQNRRELLNETSAFLDKVRDKRAVTEDDLTEFYLQISSHGMVVEPSVKRLVKGTFKKPDGTVVPTYTAVDDVSILNPRDVVQVELREIGLSRYERLIRLLLRIDEPSYQLEMAAVVR